MDLNIIVLSVAIFLWLLMALVLIQQWASYIGQTDGAIGWLCVILITITAPILILSDVIIGCLDLVFPEGWQDNDKPRF